MSNCALGRNVHIYDAKDHDTVLGGLVLTNGMTNRNFYAMAYLLRDESGATVQRGDHPLKQRKYFVLWLVHTISVTTGTHVEDLIDAVRERDRWCVITGNCRGYWDYRHYGSWITIPPENGGSINSTREGILLRANIHILFDSYDVSINSDDNYKIVCIRPDGNNIAGAHLDNQFHEHPSRPVDQLLRWHFSQAVLAHVRRKGESALEDHFPPGSDMIGEIMNGLKVG
ncbi:hypothetical protein L873DRAFT_1831920 [Choiromyces venosus 120613-1]|uniref:Uncharacterized protein n=1 Tax=Choiromyces venosus 120613-1 TaxID=1336337 RepID=A0A3N4IU15_9PEZI|nr:hypothetical protein L873DRAFT_1831920 [Choiromyces venosus 120613-1]